MFNTQTNNLNTNTLNASNNSTFNGAIFYTPTNVFSSETAIELVVDPSTSRILRRPVSIQNTRSFDERFGYVQTAHNNVISEVIISPIIDLITQFISLPSIANEQATVLADFVWRLRANNTDNIYCLSTNNRGCYWFIPGTSPDRQFIFIRPTSLRRGSGNGGFIFRCRFALTSMQPNTKVFVGVVSHSNIFDLTGANTLVAANYALGFLIDRSLNSNYNVILLSSSLGSIAFHSTSTLISAGAENDFQLEWGLDTPNIRFTYNNVSTLITVWSANPPTNVDFDPCVNVEQVGSSDWGMFIRQIKCTSYE